MVFLMPMPSDAAPTSIAGSPGPCKTMYFESVGELDQVLADGNFQIHYAVQGPQAIRNLSDADKNGIPDVVDDIALQLKTADQLYSGVLRLVHPLRQPRYAHAKHVNVFVLAMAKGNGLAFDEVINDQTQNRKSDTGCAIRMYINRDLRPSQNATPAHELFHLYQYGYAMFKRSGYLEGLARLAESPFIGKQRAQSATNWNPADTCTEILSQSYSASGYWRQRSQELHLKPIQIPVALLSRRYSDGRPVLKEQSLNGGKFIQSVLDSLQSASAKVSVTSGLPLYKWPEKIQRSGRFDQEMCAAIEKTVQQLDGGVTLLR